METQDNKPATMYNLITDRLAIQQVIEENDGEITPEIDELFRINEENLMVKAESLLDWREQLMAFVDMGKAKVKQAQEFIKKQEAVLNRIDTSLLQAATVYGQIKVDTRVISTRKSESVEIDEEGSIPLAFCNCKEVVTPDKTKIKAAIKSGVEVPGASLKTNNNLSIK